MTAVAEDTEAPAVVPAPPEPEPAETVAHRRSRTQIELEVRETLERCANRRITARRLCTGDPRVISGDLCNDGTQGFMAKAHLHPPGTMYDVRYGRERDAHVEAGEKLIRADVWKPFGDPDTDLGDFTVQGLTRRLRQATEANEKWATDFRALIVSETGVHISTQRRDEAFAALGLEPWIPHRRLEYSMRGTLEQMTVARSSRLAQAQTLKNRIIRALRAEFGDELGSEHDLAGFIGVSARDI